MLNRDVFDQVWGRFGHNFYDPKMHNQDWNKLYEKFSPYTHNLKNTNHLSKVIDEMIGTLNASHTGFTARKESEDSSLELAFAGFVPMFSPPQEGIKGRATGIKIKKVYHDSELAQKYGIKDDDTILEVNGQPIHADTEITPLFLKQVNKNIKLKIQTAKGIVDATVKGISYMDQYQLRYKDKVINNFRKVKESTDGKIGYLHIQRMNQESLRKFQQDFLAVNFNTEAMIIDVRGNSGGNIHNSLIDIISRQPNSFSYGRSWGVELSPSPSNAYSKPIVCLIDEDSFSDAEVFSILFKDLKLGKVIGMPTSGSVIGTGEIHFMDGSQMRMPRHAWYRLNMENMEHSGTKPDIEVPMLPRHIVNKEDPQLEMAIEVLRGMIEGVH
jgi:tricorn protease